MWRASGRLSLIAEQRLSALDCRGAHREGRREETRLASIWHHQGVRLCRTDEYSVRPASQLGQVCMPFGFSLADFSCIGLRGPSAYPEWVVFSAVEIHVVLRVIFLGERDQLQEVNRAIDWLSFR